VAVVRAIGTGRITLIGHSYGGGRTLRVCADSLQLVERALILDSFVHFPDMDAIKVPPQLGRFKPYPDYASIQAASAAGCP
jgi:pimeloyl-ACP methyl ester carboxylesterase